MQWGGAQVWTLQVWTFHVWTVTGTLWGERRPPPPSGRAPHPVLSAQMEGNLTPQPTCQSPRALVTCCWPERDRACTEMGVASASQSTESPDLRHPVPDVHVARPHQTHRGALPGARPSPPHTDPPARPPQGRDLPKLGAGPHGAVGEGSLALPHLLGQQAGQRREVNPWGGREGRGPRRAVSRAGPRALPG